MKLTLAAILDRIAMRMDDNRHELREVTRRLNSGELQNAQLETIANQRETIDRLSAVRDELTRERDSWRYNAEALDRRITQIQKELTGDSRIAKNQAATITRQRGTIKELGEENEKLGQRIRELEQNLLFAKNELRELQLRQFGELILMVNGEEIARFPRDET